jgi:hypothetical protein
VERKAATRLPRIRASSSTTAIFGFSAAGVITNLQEE